MNIEWTSVLIQIVYLVLFGSVVYFFTWVVKKLKKIDEKLTIIDSKIEKTIKR